MARPANSVLPPQHWAYDAAAQIYPYDPAKARQLLDQAGYHPDASGVRFHLVMKTSTDESTRLLCAVLQQQLRQVGIALDIRSYEFATFYADVVKGAFQLYSLRWVGGSNQDPDVFENLFDTASFAPKRANRGYYSNPEVDRLIAQGTPQRETKKQRAAHTLQYRRHSIAICPTCISGGRTMYWCTRAGWKTYISPRPETMIFCAIRRWPVECLMSLVFNLRDRSAQPRLG